MKQWKRLVFFLLLNVLVSACTTFAVLIAWDRLRAPLPGGLIQPLTLNLSRPTTSPSEETPVTADPSIPTPTPAFEFHSVQDGDTFESIAQTYHVSVEELIAANGYTRSQTLSPGELMRVPIHPVLIDSVIGVGDLATEHVVILSNTNGELSLAGWQIETSTGSTYTFPQVTLFVKGGPVKLFTKPGANTASELYWGLQAPVWLSGMVTTLRDPQGTIQASYTIP
jgi:LysM repeat protein